MARVGVYPRVCGGNGAVALDDFPSDGLSPRVRGKLPRVAVRHDPAGSIPACAGETVGAVCIQWAEGVYPRVCGGNCR